MKIRDRHASTSKTIAARLAVVGILGLLAGAMAWPLTAGRHQIPARPHPAAAQSEPEQLRAMSDAPALRALQPLAQSEDAPMVVPEESPPDPAKSGAPVNALEGDPATDSAGQRIGRAWAQTAAAGERIPEGIRVGGNGSFILFPDPSPSASEPNPDDQIPEEGKEAGPGRAR